MKPVPLFHRFSSKVIAGLIFMLFLVGIPFFLLFLQFHRNQILETIENSTTNMSRILARELEMSVLEGRHHLLDKVIEGLSKEEGVRNIMIIDSTTKVAISSDPSLVGRTLNKARRAGCRECHSKAVLKTTIYLDEIENSPFYRNISVIQNKPQCYACHDSKSSVNGIMVMDFSQNDLQAQFRSSLVRLLGMAAAMLVLTIAVLYILLNQLVLRKLKRFSDAAEEIGQGKFGQVSLPGNDEFSQLAARFNEMSQKLETALQQTQSSKEYLESVINNIDDEIIVIDRQYEIVTANAAYWRNRNNGRRLIPEDLCFNWADEDPESREPFSGERFACTKTFRDGQVHKELQSFVDRDGKERFVELFSCPLRDESGDIYQVIEVRRDTTERKLLEANLAHSERLASMGFLASGLAHEINNPLASISTFIDGLKRRLNRKDEDLPDGENRLDHSLGIIQREIRRAKEVSRRLLVLAQKDDSGRTLMNLSDSLKETISLVRYEASRRGIHMSLEGDADMPTLKLSESQIQQVFLNLILNSLHAGHPGGHVWCRTWHENGRVFASVEDDGSGIAAGDQVKIFEPFYSKKGPGQGTGLGLFICKSIISSLGGDITVESQAGHGARFTVWLPKQP